MSSDSPRSWAGDPIPTDTIRFREAKQDSQVEPNLFWNDPKWGLSR